VSFVTLFAAWLVCFLLVSLPKGRSSLFIKILSQGVGDYFKLTVFFNEIVFVINSPDIGV
jgi:hypothetical protein